MQQLRDVLADHIEVLGTACGSHDAGKEDRSEDIYKDLWGLYANDQKDSTCDEAKLDAMVAVLWYLTIYLGILKRSVILRDLGGIS